MLSCPQTIVRAVERFVHREDRRLGLDVDHDLPARLFERLTIVMREQDDGLFRMVHAIVREVRLIVDDERDAIDARNVGRRDDREARTGTGRAEVDAPDVAARRGTSDSDPVQHPRQREIVHVARLAGDLRTAFPAVDRVADERIVHLVVEVACTAFRLRAGSHGTQHMNPWLPASAGSQESAV